MAASIHRIMGKKGVSRFVWAVVAVIVATAAYFGLSADARATDCTPAQVSALRADVANSNSTAGVQTITLAACDYDLAGTPLELTAAATITGTGSHDGGSRLKGNGDRVLIINESMNDGFGNVTLQNLAIMDGDSNEANYGGAGVFADTGTGTLTLQDVVVQGNTAATGGNGAGLYISGADGGALVLDRVTLVGNAADGSGGALFLDGDLDLRINNSTIEDNIATKGAGGGIGFLPAGRNGKVEIRNSSFIGNEAKGGTSGAYTGFGIGGGIAVGVSDTLIANSTFSGNFARDGGGGIATTVDKPAGVTANPKYVHLTITDNDSETKAGGGLLVVAGKPELIKSIVSGNRSIAVPANNDIGLGTSSDPANLQLNPSFSSYNVVTSAAGVFSGAAGAGNNKTVADAGLNPLSVDNGGYTLTHGLTATSPARGAGGPVLAGEVNDQRGFPRLIANETAAGAVEGWSKKSFKHDTTFTQLLTLRNGVVPNVVRSSAQPVDLIASDLPLTGSGETRTLTVTPATAKYGKATYTFSVPDAANGGGATIASTLELEVTAHADLQPSIQTTGLYYETKSGATYTVNVTNIGLVSTSGNVTVTLTKPSGVTITGISGSGWSCTPATGICTRSTAIGEGQTSTLTVTFDVGPNAKGNGSLTADVDYANDENPANNDSTTSITIHPLPRVEAVLIPADGLYKAGDTLTFTVDYDLNVTLNEAGGTPSLPITIGASTKQAAFARMSGSDKFVFEYLIENGLLDADGITVGTNLSLNGAVLESPAGVPASLALSAGNTSGILVDAKAPAISTVNVPANSVYSAGEELSFGVQMDENVAVTGSPELSIELNGSTAIAEFDSVTGSLLTFKYTVQAGDNDANGIALGALSLNGGTIRDAAGNNAVLTLQGGIDTSGIIVDTTPPSVNSLVAETTSGLYKAGDDLTFKVTFQEPVTVTGTPRIGLDIGDQDRFANYVSGSGTNQLTFSYTVQAGDDDANGISFLTPGPIGLNGGMIRDAAGHDAILTVGSLPIVSGIKVDTVAPASISANVTPGTYRSGNTIEVRVAFGEPVIVAGGTPKLAITIGAVTKDALYQSGSGTGTLVFAYTLEDGLIDANGITLDTALQLGAATIADAAGNAASNVIPAPHTLTNVLVDTVMAGIGSVTIANGVYHAGDELSFVVTYSEAVSVGTNAGANKPLLAFEIGGSAFEAPYKSGSGTDTLVFAYTVRANDADGGAVDLTGTSAIQLNGGTIQDTSGNDADLDLSGVANTSGVIVDSTIPLISGATTPAAGSYIVGERLTFKLTTDSQVTVNTAGGTPSIGLVLGGATKQAVYDGAVGTAVTELSFSYTIVAGDLDADGIAIAGAGLTLNGSTIKDLRGNDLNRTLSAITLPIIAVDGVAPSIESVDVDDGTHLKGDTLTFSITYSELVTLTGGTPKLPLTIGSSAVEASFASGSGTNTLVFSYVLADGLVDSDGITIGSALQLGAATIADAAGNAAAGAIPAPYERANVKVDTTIPAVDSVTIADGIYRAGDELAFEVKYDEAASVVTPAGANTPSLAFKLGSKTFHAAYQSGSGTDTLVFAYTVQADNADGSPVNLADTAAIALNDGTIKDANGNAASLHLAGVGNTSGVIVDSVVPVVNSVDSTAGSYKLGDKLTIDLAISSDVTVNTSGGTPTLGLAIGSSTKQAAFDSAASADSKLAFSYTIAAGDLDTNGIAIEGTAIELNGAVIQDAQGNPLKVGLPAGINGQLLVDGVVPTIVSIEGPVDGDYRVAQKLTFKLNVSEPVVVDETGGQSSIALSIGGNTVQARYAGGTDPSTQLVYEYTVAAGDTDADGIGAASVLALGGAQVSDAAGNALALALPAIDLAGVNVDTTAPAAPVFLDADGKVFQTGTPTIEGTAEPGTTVHVTVTGEAIMATATANAGGKWSVVMPSLELGDAELSATATDLAGNVSPAALLNIKVTSAPTGPVYNDYVLELEIDGIRLNAMITAQDIANGEISIILKQYEDVSLKVSSQWLDRMLKLNGKLVFELGTKLGSIAIPLSDVRDRLEAIDGTVSPFVVFEIENGQADSSIAAAIKKLGASSEALPVLFRIEAVDQSGQRSSVTWDGTPTVVAFGDNKPEAGTVLVLMDEKTGKLKYVPAKLRETQGVWEFVLENGGTGSYAAILVDVSFGDMKAHWAQADVERLASMLIIEGREGGQFDPQGPITRSEFTALIARMLGLGGAPEGNDQYNDVSGEWYSDAVAAASAAGIVGGYGDGTFRPDAQVSRQEMAVMMLRALQWLKLKADLNGGEAPFGDTGEVASWAAEAVETMTEAGIIQGDDNGMFRPSDDAKRAEAAVMLLRLIRLAGLVIE
ncbi:S-layer homology domain-containing protein [Paenibacillus sp. LHD-117]|uniref:S-layer homology domain-containing protein n=1 Tax=Paenibacillus sp. LHD-117 TaxID=3071412 RepID=UPI0027DF6319|nr:S-layer homology domain-containing protein [Paenibacillus sp. LHD-117]MDQ6422917.1 S-layer homology domain-containing protein [Paenibacillus sp. LHD-117]